MNKVKKTQADKFREAAKELETDNDEKRFDKILRKISNTKTGSPQSENDKNTD